MSIKEKFIKRQIEHIRKVQDNMILLENNLDKLPFHINEFEILNRAMQHDLDKFHTDKIYKFMRIMEYKSSKNNENKNTKIDENELYSCCNKHYASQPHHETYHAINNSDYTNLDICEVCCDCFACAERNNNDPLDYCFNVSFKENKILAKHKDDIVFILNLLDLLHK